MKQRNIIGCSIVIAGGILVIFSAFLSLSMQIITAKFVQGPSIVDYFFGEIELKGVLTSSAVLYSLSILFAFLCIGMSIFALIMTLVKKKLSNWILLVGRLISIISFLLIVASLIVLGVYLSELLSIGYNIVGIGIMIALIGTLFQVLGQFLIRQKVKKKKSKQEIS